jgi:hypothetical protein
MPFTELFTALKTGIERVSPGPTTVPSAGVATEVCSGSAGDNE